MIQYGNSNGTIKAWFVEQSITWKVYESSNTAQKFWYITVQSAYIPEQCISNGVLPSSKLPFIAKICS